MYGFEPSPSTFTSDDGAGKGGVVALRARIAAALTKPPCFVAFSGGRDSSIVLAIALSESKKHGLPPPIALTLRYRNVPMSAETQWQEFVIRHLNIRDWIISDVDDEDDVLGDASRASLARNGLMWPATLHAKASLLSVAAGGTLLTGEGGDEVFGTRRVTPIRIATQLALAGRVTPAVLRDCWNVVQPRRARIAAITRRESHKIAHYLPWVRPAVRRAHAARFAADLASEPLAFKNSINWYASRRIASVGSRNYGYVARQFDVDLVEPLLDRGFLAEIHSRGDLLGPTSRTEFVTDLFSDELPAGLLARQSKAVFTGAFIGRQSHSFARRWSGGGIDPDLIDIGLLRLHWKSDQVLPGTMLLLQQAWLYEQGLGIDGRLLKKSKPLTPQANSPAEAPESATP